jgi:hypothetical protein
MATSTIPKSLASDINTINNTLASHDYYTLVNGERVVSTIRTITLLNGRKLSDYKFLIATVRRGDYYRATCIMPRSYLVADIGISMTEVDSSNTQRWYEIKYVSDTQVTIQASANTDSAYIALLGVNI